MMTTRPMAAREERRFTKRSVRSYCHIIGMNCNVGMRLSCSRCLWWSLIGKHERERRKRIEKMRARRATFTPVRRS